MNKFLFRFSLAVAVMLAWSACSPQKPPPPPPTLPVTVSRPQVATVTNWDEYPGHLEAVEMVEIRSRVPGYIESIHFQDGAEVKAGDRLFVIDPQPFQAAFAQAQAERQQAESRLELARNDFQRADALRGTKAISEEEWDSRSKAFRAAEAALAAAKASETTARINLDYTQIKAPINGKIGRRLVTPGNFVQLQGNNGAATLLTTIVSLDPIYCYFDVDEAAFLRYRDSVKLGSGADPISGVLPCELSLVNERSFCHQGRLDFFDNQVNPQTGTIRMRAVYDNGDRALVPGMFANVRIAAGPPEETLLVPDVAVGSDQGYKFVYVVDQESKAQTRSIEAGRAHGPLRAVLKGLTPEDRVVINGLLLLQPGAKVKAQEEQPTGGSPQSTVQGPQSAGGGGQTAGREQK